MNDLETFAAQRLRGTAFWGDTPFDVPIISQIEGNLWQGGSAAEVPLHRLPSHFAYVLNLYPWGTYEWDLRTTEVRVLALHDGSDVHASAVLEELADWVNEKRALKPTLVHCQVGLNRSALVTGLALIRSGMTPDAAIGLLREKRSPAVLCNPAFESWLLEQ